MMDLVGGIRGMHSVLCAVFSLCSVQSECLGLAANAARVARAQGGP